MGFYANRLLAEFVCKAGERLKEKSRKRKEAKKDRGQSVKKKD